MSQNNVATLGLIKYRHLNLLQCLLYPVFYFIWTLYKYYAPVNVQLYGSPGKPKEF